MSYLVALGAGRLPPLPRDPFSRLGGPLVLLIRSTLRPQIAHSDAHESMYGKPSRITHSDARENIHEKPSTITHSDGREYTRRAIENCT